MSRKDVQFMRPMIQMVLTFQGAITLATAPKVKMRRNMLKNTADTLYNIVGAVLKPLA